MICSQVVPDFIEPQTKKIVFRPMAAIRAVMSSNWLMPGTLMLDAAHRQW